MGSENYDESQVQEARELYEKPTVTEQWVLNSLKLGKLAPVKSYDPIKSGKLFSNCIFTMHQIDAQDRLKLYAMITLHGGAVQKELDNKVTHLLSGGSQSVAIKVAALTKNKLTIITPDWVVECLKQKKLVESDVYHPNLLVTSMHQQTSKITLMPTGTQEKSVVRSQLQQNVRPARPIIQTMQHTPQQINEIIQSQIQQQQMQEKAKQRAAAATTSTHQTPQPAVNPEPIVQQPLPQVTNQVHTQKQSLQQVINSNAQVVVTANQANANPNNQQATPNQVNQTSTVTMQRQISLQQIEANARNQKIQMISQQLQQSTQNQQNQHQLIAQQQFKQFQSNQMVSNQQQQPGVGQVNPVAVQVGQNVTQQFTQVSQQGNTQQSQTVTVQHAQQFAGQQMKQIINPGQVQNQQFTQNISGGTVKTIAQQQGGNNGNNFIQIIQSQQGQQIIQIQHPDGGPMQQKVINQQNQQIVQQQNQPISAQMQSNVPNIASQSNQGNIQVNQGVNQQQQQQPQGQNNRQNIVIINQVQNPQGMNQMALQNQRFAGIQQVQSQLKGQQQQQIIHQTIVASGNDELLQGQMQGNMNVQQSPQIIQVQQGVQQQQQQQQNVVENIMLNQKIQGAPNIVHVQQPNQGTQGMTQAQAVQQIAQQLQSGTAEIISNSMNSQQINVGNNQQMNIIQSPVHQGTPNSGNQSPQVPQSPQWIPQSPTQQASPSPALQQTVQHHIITTNQGAQGAPGGQFIRASGQRLGHIYLDAQSSIQFQRMDPTQRQEYLEQLHNKQQQQQQQQRGVMFQQRPNAPNVISAARPQHHIVIRSQVPPGLTQQQQMQWLQQNQRRQIVIRPGGPVPNAAGLSQLPPQGGQNITQFQIDPNASPQQQQLQRQHFQRMQQMQKMQSGPPTPNSPRTPGFPSNETIDGIQQQLPMDPNGVSSSKTKTALANMLSSRLSNNGNVTQLNESPVDQSAAGTLRMMTAQHNAALNVQGMPPGAVRNQQELIVLQQQQQIQPQIIGGQTVVQAHPQMQRRSLGNITNAPSGANIPNSPVIVTTQMPAGPQVMMPQSPSSNIKVQAPFSPGRAPAIPANRAQFYGHNPNLKLPPDLFLLGCHFLIVEYDETNAEELGDWKQAIKNHGGEIESCYNVKVTHVLSRTQKHGKFLISTTNKYFINSL